MADLSSVTDNYFTIASETYSDNLSASISAGATTVPVNSASTYTTGDCVVLTVDPGTANEATFIGKKDTGNQFIECVWTEGNTGIGHDTGATITDYDSATHHSAQTKGIKQFANDDGTLITSAVRSALNLVDESVAGWEVGTLPAPDTVTNNGNGSSTLTFNATDYTNVISQGMKIRTSRGTAAQVQSAVFDSSSTQYAIITDGSQTGLDITGDISVIGWYRPTEPTTQVIAGKWSASNQSYLIQKEVSGKLSIFFSATGVVGSRTHFRSYKSIPLNMWSHIAFCVDVSAPTATLYVNGISYRLQTVSSGATSIYNGSAGFALSYNEEGASSYIDGNLAQVGVFSTQLSEATVREYMTRPLTGSEPNVVAAYALDGDFTDLTANGNDLTANGGAVATDSKSPFGNNGASTTLDYHQVTAVSYSTNTTIAVQSFTSNTVDATNALNAVAYSTDEQPYGNPDKISHSRVHAPVAFRLERSTTQSITASTTTTIQFDEVRFDLGSRLGSYDTTTYIWTAPFNGIYHLGADARVIDLATGDIQYTYIVVNDIVETASSDFLSATGQEHKTPVSLVQELSAGDEVRFAVYHNYGGGSRSLTGGGGAGGAHAWGYLIARTD